MTNKKWMWVENPNGAKVEIDADRFPELEKKGYKRVNPPNQDSAVQPETKDTPKLSIIMLTYNALKYTKQAIWTVQKHTDCNYELIVIDNNSTDETQDWLKSVDIDTLILNDENMGVAGGRNQGLKEASGEYIVFLDNDVEVGSNWDTEMLKTFDKEDNVGVVGKQGNDVSCLNPLKFSNFKNDTSMPKVYSVDVVPGFCFCFPKRLLMEVGKQASDLGKFWHEDLEFCKRVQIAGYRVLANTNIDIVHHWHKSVKSEGKVTNEQMKEKHPGFYKKAANIAKKYRSENVVKIYRTVNPESCAAYDILARQMTRVLRDKGMVVVRKDTIKDKLASFNHCKGFDILCNGNRFILAHQENNAIPENWHQAYELVDYAFCVSPHVYDVLKADGIDEEKLINIHPNGVNIDKYNTDIEVEITDDEPFQFIMVGATQPRKGTDILIEAFAEAFDSEDDVKLLIKDGGYGHQDWTVNMIEKAKVEKDVASIEYINDFWSIDKLAKMYRKTALNGAYIHPHRAEAFGLPLFEALACGCQVGTTNWGGAKYLLKGIPTVELFDYSLTESSFHNNSQERYYQDKTPKWAEPNLTSIINWMREVYENKYPKRKANKVARDIREEYNYDKTMTDIYEAIKKYSGKVKYAEIEK